MNEDIKHILDRWAYEPGELRVRRIIGNDGSIKIQMRLNLGLLQMEATGRPDGSRPHGKESLLDHYEARLADHVLRHGTDERFRIGAQVCHELREEGVQYYHRYLSNFLLEEYAAVVRDTDRNVRLLDFISKYARHEADRESLEGYRPYILMMNARARAHLALGEDDLDRALAEVNSGLEKIRKFFTDHDRPQLLSKSHEIQVLTKMREELLSRRPRSQLDILRERLTLAVETEDFKNAAQLRDEIRRLEEAKNGSPSQDSRTADT